MCTCSATGKLRQQEPEHARSDPGWASSARSICWPSTARFVYGLVGGGDRRAGRAARLGGVSPRITLISARSGTTGFRFLPILLNPEAAGCRAPDRRRPGPSSRLRAGGAGTASANASIEHVEPAGIGAEGRHHQAVAVGGEAAAPDHRTAPGDARHRVQMAGDLPRRCRPDGSWRSVTPQMVSVVQIVPPIEAGRCGS